MMMGAVSGAADVVAGIWVAWDKTVGVVSTVVVGGVSDIFCSSAARAAAWAALSEDVVAGATGFALVDGEDVALAGSGVATTDAGCVSVGGCVVSEVAGAAGADCGSAGAEAAGVSTGGVAIAGGEFCCSAAAPDGVTTIGGGVSAFVETCCASGSPIFSINAARAAAWAGLSSARAQTEMKIKLAQTLAAQNVKRSLGNRIMSLLFYAKSASDATAFRLGKNCLCHAPGNGQLKIERNKIPRTSFRETFTRCCNSITSAARSFSIVFMPIKIGHAQASRTRNCQNGIVFV